MAIKTSMTVELEPFGVPNFARVVKRSIEDETTIHLTAVDANALSALCDQFRADVFAKAKQKDPRLA